jgi:hypothetical protein
MKHLACCALLALGACALDPDEPVAADDSSPFLPDGTVGVDRVIRHGDEEAIPWIARDGKKYVSEDFAIGPALVKNELVATPQTLGWPRAIMPYCIHDIADNSKGLTSAQQTQLDGELAALAKVLPINFERHPCATIVTELAAEGLGNAYVDYLHWNITTSNETVGPIGHAAGWTIHLVPVFHDGDVWHETGHAVGYMHEQQRPDREDHVNYYPDCVKAGDGATLAQTQGNFTEAGNSTNELTPYDINSVMEYSSYSFAKYDAANNIICPPILFGGANPATAPVWGHFTKGDGTVLTLRGSLITPPGTWSPEDINGTWVWYEQALGSPETNDMLGTSMVSADFDGDGYDDLAVGAIGEQPYRHLGGAVLVYKGTSTGLVAWKVLYEGQFDTFTAHSNDDFGFTLAAGDVTGDGIADLVIGAPLQGTPQGGAVFIYKGGASGPTKLAGPITQSSLGAGTSESTDMFGAAIAIGKFAGGSKAYIAVGAPYEHPNPNAGSRGVVSLFAITGSTPSFWLNVHPEDAGIGIDSGMFGYALAAGDLDSDGVDDLIVGAPAVSVGTGNVAPFYGRTGSTPLAGALLLPSETLVTGDRFGISVAYNKTKVGTIGLAVGASGKAGVGRVYQFGPFGGTVIQYGIYHQNQIVDQVGVRGDNFGAVVAIGDLDNDGLNDIAVGVSGKTIAGKLAAGEVALFLSKNSTNKVIVPTAPNAQDRFGTSIALGNFDAGRVNPVRTNTQLDLAVGIQGRMVNGHSNAGVFNTYKGTSSSLWRQFAEDTHAGP